PYWDDWQEECALADQIVVNSIWSRDALVSEGIEANKINVVPLAYASPSEAKDFQRCYPETFTAQRPLRVLFLGQVTLLKGILPLLEAARLVEREPIEFQIVGTLHAHLPAEIRNRPNVFWRGGVKRSEVAEYYREADVFVFPSYSDGFGLTQLEAQAWKLPVIASRFCGDVVRDGDNGLLLDDVSGKAIANVVLDLVRNPNRLRHLSAQSEVGDKFSLDSLASALLSLPTNEY
ncbi:MAG: glycosyltransferase family 4 protein, partial [Acidobacteriota bacterium]|nr:glycosyltransferase family 4 protein [Acidobacteriota bacterium]